MNLESPVTELPLVGPHYAQRLSKLDIYNLRDLLYHIPHRYLDFSKNAPIKSLQIDDLVTVRGQVVSIKNQYTRYGKKLQLAQIKDTSGEILVVWFNQPFLTRVLNIDDDISLAGKVGWFGRNKAIISPEFEKITKASPTLHTGRLIPVYSETAGISSKWLRGRIQYLLDKLGNQLEEYLPKQILDKYNYPTLSEAIVTIHFPDSIKNADLSRQRLAFNELLNLQFANLAKKITWQKNKPVYKLDSNENEIEDFIHNLPFKLTSSQKIAWKEIKEDLTKQYPMNRLLEGDVGSGKTVVAAICAFTTFSSGYQTVFMAPTQILAQQHYETLESLLGKYKVRIALFTSGIKKKDLGQSDIIVGTHSLLHQKEIFEKVAVVVIDEQQKFGVLQRDKLLSLAKNKKGIPHLLTMTATPIPRTVALTYYGDLDLSILKDLPTGRQRINTWVVNESKRDKAYKWISNQIKNEGTQVFIVCPLIEESEKDTLNTVKSVTKEYAKLTKIFKGFELGLLHGRLKAKDKELIISRFRQKEIDILVSTPVVEVGIDIPNANIMVIEGADRYGLSSLHQLRGRVGRGNKKAYCLLFTEVQSNKVTARLNAMEKNISGFELAELDLSLRGPGEIFGTKQHGFPELKIATWQDLDIIKNTKSLAYKILVNQDKYRKFIDSFTSGITLKN